MLEELKREVCGKNFELAEKRLAPLTWGNVSGIDRDQGLVVIKPSGVSYESLIPEGMAVVDLDGKPVDGPKPSTDLPTHLALYNAWPEIGGITHTHSVYATMFAQAGKPLPCLGTTHVDYFRGEIPITRPLTETEIESGYELNTGKVIVERFRELDPLDTSGVLVIHHGPFTWGKSPGASLENGLVLELVAKMALGSLLLTPDLRPIPSALLKKHYTRKHGPDSYYGQKGDPE